MIPERYTLNKFKRALHNPKLIGDEMTRLARAGVRKGPWALWGSGYKSYYGDGEDVARADWDTLIILDSCRYDFFEQLNTMEGRLKRVISCGSTTKEFLLENFVNVRMDDTVYVTSNPHVLGLDDDIFYARVSALDKWDDDVGTVMPEEFVNSTLSAHDKYPNKRLIAHFMPPHAPHIGETAESLRTRSDVKNEVAPTEVSYLNHDRGITGRKGSLLDECRRGNITLSELRKSYAETLQLTLKEVKTLIAKLDGKTVVTSDHGVWLGDRHITTRRYGKESGVWAASLREVPWFEPPYGERRKISSGDETGLEEIEEDEQTLNSRLRALGYKTD